MMNKLITAIWIFTFCAAGCFAKQNQTNPPVFDLTRAEKTTLSQVIPDLTKKQIILVGEHHSNESHHRAQLQVIQALSQAGARVAIGLEMFRNDSQLALDRWISGDLTEDDFQKYYYDNWNFPYSAYGPIFEYARENKIPLIGLNVSRDITRQVSRKGFQSLSKEQRGKLSEVTCRVDEAYMKYIRKAYGAHAHGNLNFAFFCEAQLVWDSVMAINSLNFIETSPQSIVVILTGIGHAQKAAIPQQIAQRSNLPLAVILPEVPGTIDAQAATTADADYLILGL
jgi:uncharacterized iron-regulated protein